LNLDSFPNRRELPRTECLIPVHYKVNLRPYSGFILDLSETGAFVETDREFGTNGKISLRYLDPYSKRPSLINGIIAWNRDNAVGVKFKHIFSFPINN
jgi:hypothetical protein